VTMRARRCSRDLDVYRLGVAWRIRIASRSWGDQRAAETLDTRPAIHASYARTEGGDAKRRNHSNMHQRDHQAISQRRRTDEVRKILSPSVSRSASCVGGRDASFHFEEGEDIRRKSPMLLRSARAPRTRGATTVARRAGQRGGPELLRARDLIVLAWICEQYAARTDQLEVLLHSGLRTVQRVLTRLRSAGLIDTRRLLVGAPAWVIPTSAGLRTAGQGFGVWHPRIGLLAHVAAVNDVRLHIQARSPDSEWVPERVLARERETHEHLPDALVITEGQRVAIEVELTVKSQKRVRAILDELSSRYDTILYWCAPGPHRQLSGLCECGQWPKLGIRELPLSRGSM